MRDPALRAKLTPTYQPMCKRQVMAGCSSWYLGKDGLPELLPWRPERHRELLRRPVLADFDIRTL